LSEKIGWVWFFVLTSVVGLPALLLFLWVGPRDDFKKQELTSTGDIP
jgi:predicted MFS family arabinose efflux permease